MVVQRKLTGGFLVSDPLLPTRTMLTESLIRRDAHQKVVGGDPYIFVLRLIDRRGTAAPAFAPRDEDERVQGWADTYRLPRALPPRKITITASIVRGASKFLIGDGGQLRNEETGGQIVATRGMGHGSQLSLGFSHRGSAADLTLFDTPFSLGRSSRSSATIDWTTFHSWSMPAEVAASTSVRANWSTIGAPDTLSGSIELTKRASNFGFSLNTELLIGADIKNLSVIVTPTVSYSLPLGRGYLTGASVTMPTVNLRTPTSAYLSAFVSHNISPNLSLALYADREMMRLDGTSDSHFGIALTWGIPRRMR